MQYQWTKVAVGAMMMQIFLIDPINGEALRTAHRDSWSDHSLHVLTPIQASEKKAARIPSKFVGVDQENITVVPTAVHQQSTKKVEIQQRRTHPEKIPPQFKTYITEYERQLKMGKSVEESQKAAAKAVVDEKHRNKDAKTGPFPAAAVGLIVAVPLGISVAGCIWKAFIE